MLGLVQPGKVQCPSRILIQRFIASAVRWSVSLSVLGLVQPGKVQCPSRILIQRFIASVSR
ncbi:hypothetical protein ASF64_06830 [Arthrobacter sp. Leaf137]|nr:hypothetical protein ASF64_06830 [Arthrobacter sp. Leaf137]